MKLTTLLACGAMLMGTAAYAQQTAQGIVFDDRNNNGQLDRGEQGLPGVSVTNGRLVVQTNARGQFSLPVGNDNIISVIKPEGYAFALNAYNRPKSFFIHKPQGSPQGMKYKGVAPTGALPKAINFALHKTTEPAKFTALIFGDPQPYNDQEVEYFNRSIVDEVTGIKNVAFGLCLGDLVGDTLNLHPAYRAATARVGLPWYDVKGNHDMNYDVTADSLNDETFEVNFGPANYAFNYGKVHFIVLDDIRYPNPRGGKGYLGGFRKEQLDFVENDLRFVPKDRLIVLAFHIPLFHENGDRFRPEDRDRLFSILGDRPNTLSLSAHTHVQEQLYYGKGDNWKRDLPHHEYNVGTTCGDWWSGQFRANGLPETEMRDGTPQGYAFMDFDGNACKLRWKVAGKPAGYQISLTHPKYVNDNRGSNSALYANVFMGDANTRVEYSLDGSKWKPMEYVKVNDPGYVAMLTPYDVSKVQLTGRRPSDAQPSTHLWKVALPWRLKDGGHQIKVRAANSDGSTFSTETTYVVAKPLVAKR